MNKRLIGVSIIFLIAVLAMGSASAVSHDFDGQFSMNIPKGTTFQKEDMSNGEEGINILYMNDELMVEYFDSVSFSEESSKYFYQTTFEMANSDLDQCYETQEGNVTLLQPVTSDGQHFPMAFVESGHKMVIVIGEDASSIKKMAESVVFE